MSDSQGCIYIHAVNIHTGGGGVLLQGLLQALPTDRRVFLLADTRLALPDPPLPHVTTYRFKPKIWQRLRAEWLLFRLTRANDTVFCFGNLPPLLPNRAPVTLYLHNRYLIDHRSLADFNLRIRLRIAIERWWFYGFSRNVDKLWVQTTSMQRLLQTQSISQRLPPDIAPFMTYLPPPQTDRVRETLFDFIYIASGEPHKNHQRLVEAWCELAEQGLYPRLCLVLAEPENKYVKRLLDRIKQQQITHRLNITFFNTVPFGESLSLLYQQSRALIYPSLIESFGLPLLEAKQQGLAIVASELDYVRDIVEPDHTFDPFSSVSIARAVMRF